MTKAYVALWPSRQSQGLGLPGRALKQDREVKTEECTEDKYFFVVQTETLSLLSLMGHKDKQ